MVLSAETLAGRCVRIHSLPCPVQECGYRLVSGSGNDNNATHSVVVTGHPDTVQYLWQRFMLLSTSSQQRPLVLSLTQSLCCDFTGQRWRNNLYKGKVLVLHCSINHTRPEHISKHSVSGQGRDQIPQHLTGLNSIQAIY